MPPEPEDSFMSMNTASANNWDVRISLYNSIECFKVTTCLTEFSLEGIEVEYVQVNGEVEHG